MAVGVGKGLTFIHTLDGGAAGLQQHCHLPAVQTTLPKATLAQLGAGSAPVSVTTTVGQDQSVTVEVQRGGGFRSALQAVQDRHQHGPVHGRVGLEAVILHPLEEGMAADTGQTPWTAA